MDKLTRNMLWLMALNGWLHICHCISLIFVAYWKHKELVDSLYHSQTFLGKLTRYICVYIHTYIQTQHTQQVHLVLLFSFFFFFLFLLWKELWSSQKSKMRSGVGQINFSLLISGRHSLLDNVISLFNTKSFIHATVFLTILALLGGYCF